MVKFWFIVTIAKLLLYALPCPALPCPVSSRLALPRPLLSVACNPVPSERSQPVTTTRRRYAGCRYAYVLFEGVLGVSATSGGLYLLTLKYLPLWLKLGTLGIR